VIVAQVKLAADGSMSTGAVTEQILISGSTARGLRQCHRPSQCAGQQHRHSASVTGKLCLP
jgi:hypothetical protein